MNIENMQQVQLALEQRGIDAGREAYLSQVKGRTNAWTGKESKRTEADLPPGQVLMQRACGPVALAMESVYDDYTNGYAGTGRDAAPYLTPLVAHKGFETIAYMALRVAMSNLGETRTRCILALTTGILDELRQLAFEHGHSTELDADGNPKPLAGLHNFLVIEARKASGSMVHQKRVLETQAARHGISAVTMSDAVRTKLGMDLLMCVVSTTGWFQLQERVVLKGRKRTTEQYLEPTDEFAALLEGAHDIAAMTAPVWPVSVVKPTGWTSMWDGPYQSEHLKARLPMVKVPDQTVLSQLNGLAYNMQPVFKAVNALQAVGVRINAPVLDFVEEMWTLKKTVAGLPPQARLPDPDMKKTAPHLCPVADAYKAWAKVEQQKAGKDGWAKVRTPEKHARFEQEYPLLAGPLHAFIQWKLEAKETWDFNEHPRRIGDMLEARNVLSTAREMVDLDTPFYFPHQLDFRGRAYTVPQHLNPQGSDLTKGILVLASAKRIGERGIRALAIHGANVWDQGLSKGTFLERILWVQANEAKILATARDPWSTVSWWESYDDEGNLTGAESPVQFIAFCMEWAGVKRDGSDFMSSLPVFADGSCNGIQHWAALLRDETTAPKVNLVDSDRPGDIYADVSRYVDSRVATDAAGDDEAEATIASFWIGKISRGLVKRPVMTKAYGLTATGARAQLKAELKKNKKTEAYRRADKAFQKLALTYLAKATQDGIKREVKAAAVGMDWMQTVAGYLAKAGVPLNWSTPDGFIVWQGYKKKKAVKVQTYLSGSIQVPRVAYMNELIDEDTGEVIQTSVDTSKLVSDKAAKGTRMVVTYQEETNELDPVKQALAVAPNFVHSLDATAMRLCVARCADLGIEMMTVHDSFGCHAADYDTMQQVTRDVFVEMHSKNLLADWFDQVTVMLALAPNGADLVSELKELLVEKFGGVTPPVGTFDLELVRNSTYFFA